MSKDYEKLSKFLGGTGTKDENDPAQVFINILETPDEQFDEFYPILMSRVDEIFSSPALQKQVLTNLEQSPYQDLEAGAEYVDSLIKEIDETWDLSDNKKNMLKTFLTKSKELTLEVSRNPRERIEVKVHRISPDAILPTYAHNTDAGADIYSVTDIVINPHETVIVPTGLTVAIPVGYMIQIYPRSGLSLKTGLRVANSVGIIDTSYRGEIGVIMTNIGYTPETIKKGDRIAQMIIAPTPMIQWSEVEELDTTERGEGGFGSTGKS